MNFETVILEKEGKIARLILNRPEKLNAINDAMMRDIEGALKEVEQDENIWVVIIKGAGSSFSVGQDLSGEGTSLVMPPDPRDRHYLSEIWRQEQQRLLWWQYIFHFPKFTIGQVQGYALAWGCYLAMVCHNSIASEDAVFGDPSIRMGFACPIPLFPWRVGIRKAKELLFTGKYISGKEAARIGLVTMAVPPDRLEEEVDLAIEAIILGASIGGYDSEAYTRGLFGRGLFDLAGLAAAWDFTANLHALSSIQRRGFEPSEFCFWEVKDDKGWKEAIRERDKPFKELGF